MNTVSDPAPRSDLPVAPAVGVDFERRLVTLLGLPFDTLGVTEAAQHIRNAAFANRRCFVSTPNLNFAIAARTDADFRGSVLRSDLSLVDGMPLVWIARLLGLPIRERVAGSDVFEALQAHPGPPLRVFLFGAPPGVAETASDRINRRGGGIHCVGFDTPGFGSVESMSDAERIGRINASGAHFVVVALGAKKGQAWIEHNAPHLVAPVLSHLGAVLNFAAGSVRRAPRWMQTVGLEWLWRIAEEPGLWRRYRDDGIAALRLLVTRVLPDAIAGRQRRADAPPARLETVARPGGTTLTLHGDWREPDLPALRAALTQCTARPGRVAIDLARAANLDSAVIATLLLARSWFGARGGFALVGVSATVQATLRRRLADNELTGAMS